MWRTTIKDSPNPGTYDTHLNTFIKEIVARPMTYGFKSDGRRRDPQPLEPKGKRIASRCLFSRRFCCTVKKDLNLLFI